MLSSKVKRFEEGSRILHISTKSYFSGICVIFDIDFLYNAGLPSGGL